MISRAWFRFAVVLTTTALAGASLACLNDRDSLAQESRRRPGVLEDLVGWFPVHPPLYYQMRAERATAELAARPNDLNLYDDIAVAFDRLGNDAEAIRVIERKRAAMIRLGIPEPPPAKTTIPFMYAAELRARAIKSSRDPWYRYYANLGTFWVHRWLRSSRSERRQSWIDTAQRDIDHAVEINPYSHGLREFAQAEAIRWLRRDQRTQTLGDFISDDTNVPAQRKVPALAGLIELGGAWESVDVYQAIAHIEQGDLSRVAEFRVYELQHRGIRSLTGHVFTAADFSELSGVSRHTGTETESEYRMLRRATDDYRAYRTNYELSRLRQGRHPDTDPHFYDDFRERKFPDFGFRPSGFLFWFFMEGPGIATAPILLVVALGMQVRRRKDARSRR